MRPIVLLTLLLILGIPASASAAFVEVISEGGVGEVRYTAAPGERNNIAVRSIAGVWSISDAGAPVQAGPGCRQTGASSASCTNQRPAFYGLVVLAGDLGDIVTTPPAPSSSVFGGAGDDTLLGGLLDDQLSGGPGNDRILGGGGTDTIAGGPGDDRVEFLIRPTELACGAGIDVLGARRGVRLLSAAMPRDCERVQLGPFLLSSLPRRTPADFVFGAGCDEGATCQSTVSMKLLPTRGPAVALGRGGIRLGPQQGGTVRVALGPDARRLLGAVRGGRLEIDLISRSTGAGAGQRRVRWRIAR